MEQSFILQRISGFYETGTDQRPPTAPILRATKGKYTKFEVNHVTEWEKNLATELFERYDANRNNALSITEMT